MTPGMVRMERKRKTTPAAGEDQLFRKVMDNFKPKKTKLREAMSQTLIISEDAETMENVDTRSIEGGVVSDLPEGWRRVRRGGRVVVVTDTGVRLTSQAAVDMSTRLLGIPAIRLHWQDMVVLPRGARFDQDPIVIDSDTDEDVRILEPVGGAEEDITEILEHVPEAEESLQDRDNESGNKSELPYVPHQILEKAIFETENNNSAGPGVFETDTNYESENSDDGVVILEAKASDIILETVYENETDKILESVEDNVNNCTILEQVERGSTRVSYVSSFDSRSLRSSNASSFSSSSKVSSRRTLSFQDVKEITEETEPEADLPHGWERRVHKRATGKQDWSMVTREGRVVRSQKQLDIYTKMHGLKNISLKGPMDQPEPPTIKPSDNEKLSLKSIEHKEISAGEPSKEAKAAARFKQQLQGGSREARRFPSTTFKPKPTKTAQYEETEGPEPTLPCGWERRVTTRTTGKQDWSMVTREGRVVRSQRQLDLYTRQHGLKDISLKCPLDQPKPPVTSASQSNLNTHENIVGKKALGLEQGTTSQSLVTREPVCRTNQGCGTSIVVVRFVSDDGDNEAAAEEETTSTRSLRRKKGKLEMEDKHGKMKGKVRRILEPTLWLKPSKSKENYGLGSQREVEGDSEAAPRKVVPLWAQWDQVDAAMEEQEEVEPLLVFGECGAPDLTLMFGPRCRRGARRARRGAP